MNNETAQPKRDIEFRNAHSKGDTCKHSFHLMRFARRPREFRALFTAASRKGIRLWLVDSGADIVVVPPKDPAIMCVSEHASVRLATASGTVVVPLARVMTPFGSVIGAISPNSPRLLPTALLAEMGACLEVLGPRSARLVADGRRQTLWSTVQLDVPRSTPVLIDRVFQGITARLLPGGGDNWNEVQEHRAYDRRYLYSADEGVRAAALGECGEAGQGPATVDVRPVSQLDHSAAFARPSPPHTPRQQGAPKPKIKKKSKMKPKPEIVPKNENDDAGGETITTPASENEIVQQEQFPETNKIEQLPVSERHAQLPDLERGVATAPESQGSATRRLEFGDSVAGPSDTAVPRSETGPVAEIPIPTFLLDHCAATVAIAAPARARAPRHSPRPPLPYNEHDMHGHFPPSADCDACRRARGRRAVRHRELPAALREERPDAVHILIDYKVMNRAASGEKWLLIIRVTRANDERSPFYTHPCRTRGGSEAVEALHAARVFLDVEGEPFCLHSDWEAGFRGPDARRYLRDHNGVAALSVPYRAESKAAVESAVRHASEGVIATLIGSGAPMSYWGFAARDWWIREAYRIAYSLRALYVAELPPFLALGSVHIPRERYCPPPECGRCTPVAFLRIEVQTGAGIRVLFHNVHKGTMQQTVVYWDDVEWTGRTATQRNDTPGAINLVPEGQSLAQADLEGIVPYAVGEEEEEDFRLVQCERCEKWRLFPDAGDEGPEQEIPFICERMYARGCEEPIERNHGLQNWLRCDADRCRRWHRVTQRVYDDMADREPFLCGDLGYSCEDADDHDEERQRSPERALAPGAPADFLADMRALRPQSLTHSTGSHSLFDAAPALHMPVGDLLLLLADNSGHVLLVDHTHCADAPSSLYLPRVASSASRNAVRAVREFVQERLGVGARQYLPVTSVECSTHLIVCCRTFESIEDVMERAWPTRRPTSLCTMDDFTAVHHSERTILVDNLGVELADKVARTVAACMPARPVPHAAAVQTHAVATRTTHTAPRMCKRCRITACKRQFKVCSICHRERARRERRAFAAAHGIEAPASARKTKPVPTLEVRDAAASHFSSILNDEWLCSDEDISGLPTEMACVTRTATKGEKNSPQGLKARQEEMEKLFKFECFAEPCTHSEMCQRDPDGTYSGVAVLTSMKHVELPEAQRKYKARAVLLGDNIKRIANGRQVFPHGTDYGLHGDVSTLPSLRIVLTHALAHDASLESVDLTAAYLQAEWPKGVPAHYVSLTPDAYSALPESAREAADRATGGRGISAYWRIGKCLYGHPVSGDAWISKFRAFLLDEERWDPHGLGHGWVAQECDPSLYLRSSPTGSQLVNVYVDDVLASGKDLSAFWEEVTSTFLCDSPETAAQFLGIQLERKRGPGTQDEFRIDMTQYAALVVSTFLEIFPGTPLFHTLIPMSDDLSESNVEAHTPDVRIQKMVGMLLWLSRCGRPEVAFATSRLGSRVGRWTHECMRELTRMVSFLKHSPSCKMHLTIDRSDVRPFSVQVHSDAGWADPALVRRKGQSGYVLFVGREGDTMEECRPATFLPVSWGSKLQSINADSTGAAELIAAHFALRQVLMTALTLSRILPGANPTLVLGVDNATVRTIGTKGYSSNLAILGHSKFLRIRLALLCDMSDFGLIEIVHASTAFNRGDIFTKALAKQAFINAADRLGVGPGIRAT